MRSKFWLIFMSLFLMGVFVLNNQRVRNDGEVCGVEITDGQCEVEIK